MRIKNAERIEYYFVEIADKVQYTIFRRPVQGDHTSWEVQMGDSWELRGQSNEDLESVFQEYINSNPIISY